MLIIRRENRIPAEKTHLQKCLRRKVCREFREGQNLHNYYFADWLNASFAQPLVKVRCFVKDKQEPWARGRGVTGSYLIVRRSASLPRFDERFVNYGYNKVQWVANLRYAGYRFYVLGTDFAMDVAHPRWEREEKVTYRSKLQVSFLNTMREKHVIMNQDLYASFLNGLLKSRKSVTRTCGRGGVEVELDASIDF